MFDDKKNKILSPWAYVGYRFLYSIPLIGWIFLLVHSFSNKNQNRKNFAISIWCMTLVVVILAAIASIILVITGVKEAFDLKNMIEQLFDSLPYV